MGSWSGNKDVDEYHWTQDEADAVLSRHEGQWFLSRSMSMDAEWKHDYLGDISTDEAFKAADKILWQEFADYHQDRDHKPSLTIVDRVRDAIQDRNEDGMIRIPWFEDRKGPYVVQVTSPGQDPQYLSAAGIRDQGQYVDGINMAATFERKGDAKYFAHITGQQPEVAGSNIAVVTESQAQTNYRDRLDREATQELREEVMAAHEAWQNDIQDYELEQDYFDKMTRLDNNLAERGLERGEDICEELPFGTHLEPPRQSLNWASDRSLNQSQNRGRGQ